MAQDGVSSFSSLGPNLAREILSRHGAENFIRILGPLLTGNIPIRGSLAAASSIYTDYTVRASEAERRKAYEKIAKELPQLIDHVLQKNVAVIDGAFNSGLRYRNAFAGTAFIGVTLAVKEGINAIKEELSIQTIGNVQARKSCQATI